MRAAPTIVHVIVDRDYGERLRDLPVDAAVWVADTPMNNPIIESIRPARSVTPYPGFNTGITAFTVSTDGTPEDWLIGVLDPVDVHHCGYSQSPPYSSLRVIGTVLTPRIRERLESYDFVKFEDLPEGFIAHKSAGAL
jgi:hypothetical protein